MGFWQIIETVRCIYYPQSVPFLENFAHGLTSNLMNNGGGFSLHDRLPPQKTKFCGGPQCNLHCDFQPSSLATEFEGSRYKKLIKDASAVPDRKSYFGATAAFVATMMRFSRLAWHTASVMGVTND